MNRPPAFQVYAKDFRSSPMVRRMTLAEIGLLLVLWAASWDSESPGTLPSDPWTISKITGTDVRILRKFLAKYPEIYSESTGNLHIKFLRHQYEELQQRRMSQSAGANSTNKKRAAERSVTDSVSARSAPASASSSSNDVCSLMQFPQDPPGSKQQERVSSISEVDTAFKRAARVMADSRNSVKQDPQRAHLEAGIYRKKIADAYFDATRGGMGPDACVQEALREGVRSMLGNRGAELRGATEDKFVSSAWDQILGGLGALHAVQNFETRSLQVVAVCTRVVTDLAYEFWKAQTVETVATG